MPDLLPKAARALWYVAPQSVELRDETLGPLAPDHLRVRMLWSALSRGTERLIYHGLVPPQAYDDMQAPFQKGTFPFPVKYGYCAVGQVVAGASDFEGRNIFCLHPHQTYFDVPRTAAHILPDGLLAKHAVLTANMETALNALWDSRLSAGERVLIIGAGVVGLLITFLAARMIGTEVFVYDVDDRRAPLIELMGGTVMSAQEAHGAGLNADCVFHTSATQEGLNLVLQHCDVEARVVEVSWYGAREVTLALGAQFHARRLSIIASQVGRIAPRQRPRWDYARRLNKAMQLLMSCPVDALLTEACAFADMPAKIGTYLGVTSAHLTCAISYKGD